MQVRSVTLSRNLTYPVDPGPITEAGQVGDAVRRSIVAAGIPVQTLRLAAQPLSRVLAGTEGAEVPAYVRALESACTTAGIDYFSLGPIEAAQPDSPLDLIDALPAAVQASSRAFCSVTPAGTGLGINLAAVRRCAATVRAIAETTPDGFGNLQFAVTVNCPPLGPFLPSAYHDGGSPSFAIALEAADLAVTAFTDAPSLDAARASLLEALNAEGRRLLAAVAEPARRSGWRFAGLDISLAPFPEHARGIGTAIERLTGGPFGGPGTFFAAAVLTDILHATDLPVCGFSGLMLPVLEDTTLAQRAAEGRFGIDSLLLYAAACGTGLDTLPLPGDVGESGLANLLLDLCALALRLDKPLTARLLPVPGLAPGDETRFSFPYFVNSRVMALGSSGNGFASAGHVPIATYRRAASV